MEISIEPRIGLAFGHRLARYAVFLVKRIDAKGQAGTQKLSKPELADVASSAGAAPSGAWKFIATRPHFRLPRHLALYAC